jgi:hypothetical protein
VLDSPGRPLDAATRSFMEARVRLAEAPVPATAPPQAKLAVHPPDGADERQADRVADAAAGPVPAAGGPRYEFGRVRVHTDGRAGESARAVGALAYTVGSDVVFGTGQYLPHTDRGRWLLAHELAHVVQQAGAAPALQRATRGAGGCATPGELDEDENGPKGAGRTAHTQIQSFLSPRILGEVQIPRGTKTRLGDPTCPAEGTPDGFADLYRRSGVVHEIGEIKPIRSDPAQAVLEAEHYIRRAGQSTDRSFGGTGCPGQPAGADDRDFTRRVGIGRFPPFFEKLTGVLAPPTVIGRFDGDQSRTLKAQLQAPGAVGYWCTGGASDTFTCGVSPEELARYVDQVALGPAQAELDRFLEEAIERRLANLLEQYTLGEILEIGERRFGSQVRDLLRPFIGQGADVILSRASTRQLGELLETAVGPEARAVVTTLLRRFVGRLVAELRAQLRAVLVNLVRDALLALCVGAPAVTLVDLIDRLRDSLRDATRTLAPVAVGVAAAALASEITAAVLAQMTDAIGRALGAVAEVLRVVGEILLRVLAALLVILLAAGVLALAIVTVIAVVDPVPGDEVVLAAVTAFLARLIPVVGQFVLRGA